MLRFLLFMNALVVRAVAFLVGLLPYLTVVGVKDRLRVVRKIDYPHDDIYLFLDSPSEFKRLYYHSKERGTTGQWIPGHFRPGDVFYDVGANVGGYSFIAAKFLKGDCAVYAFEPSFSTFSKLCANTVLNGLGHVVTPFNVALNDRSAVCRFNLASLAPGVAGACHGLSGHPNERRVEGRDAAATIGLMSCRLDDMVAWFGLRPPTHVKIDVDGSERFVLAGAEETLKSPGLRTIQVEIHQKFDPDGSIVALLQGHGFTLQGEPRQGNNLFVRG